MHARNRRRQALTALVGLTAAAALMTAAPSQAVGRYADPTGDSNGAPDLTGTLVTSDSNGQILFTIGVTGLVRGAQTGVVLVVDADLNPGTGNPQWLGAEYLLFIDQESYSYGFASWNGTDWNFDAPSTTLQIRDAPNLVLVSVNASELGATRSFNFSVATIGAAEGQTDNSPSEGHFSYSLAAGGPEIRSVRIQRNPASPRAGRAFTLTPASLELPPNGGLLAPTPAPDSYTCRARLGAKAIRGTGKGGCTLRLPKNAKGKTLTVLVTVNYQGASKTTTVRVRVR